MYGCCFKSKILWKLHENQAQWVQASFHSNVSFQPSALYTLMCLRTLSAGPRLTLGWSRYLLITIRGQWPLPRPVLSELLCWGVLSTLIFHLQGFLASHNPAGQEQSMKTTRLSLKVGLAPTLTSISSQHIVVSLQAGNTVAAHLKLAKDGNWAKWIIKPGPYGEVHFMGFIFTSMWCDWKKLICTNWFWVKCKKAAEKPKSRFGDKHLKHTCYQMWLYVINCSIHFPFSLSSVSIFWTWPQRRRVP